MNTRQLIKLGVPQDCIKTAIAAIQTLAQHGVRGRDVKLQLKSALDDPRAFLDHALLGEFANAVLQDREFVPPAPIEYRTWGLEGIDQQSHAQMQQACRLPVARAAALMPDAHVGYGLPIGGVLACENAVIPYAVGVDIACRMKLSILDMPVDTLQSRSAAYVDSLQQGTRFGVGAKYDRPRPHDVMDLDWTVSRITRESKDRAWRQLGTSGSGNHFVEFGVLTIPAAVEELGVAAGSYAALLSHSGSRGTGAAVCSTYSAIARNRLPARFAEAAHLAWLDLDTQQGQEYWAAMNLMGAYAAANHDVIHHCVTELLGAEILAGVENHHNFAWKEVHEGREWIVHRKGATPAGRGVLGIIPGSMADPAFVVRGKGVAAALDSAAHGAGRQMSRKQANATFRWNDIRNRLAQQGVHVISAGADEVPGAYKDIREVMRQQADLVEIIAQFDPKIVKMCGDGSRAED